MNGSGVRQAVAAAGSQVSLAKQLGVSPPAVNLWLRRGWVPLRRAMEIETLFGVPRACTMNPRVKDLVNLAQGVGA